MKHALLLCSVALPSLWAGGAMAQVSIPLPPRSGAPDRAPPEGASTPIPLPGTPIPLPTPESTPTPAPTVPQVPIGPHGRPDINPYERDIDMTVPLTFQSRSLGDIPMRLTADDRFMLDAATFVRLMRPILNDEAQAGLAERLGGLESFGPDDLERTGVRLTYDPSSLAVVVVEVAPDQRAVQDLFAPPRDDLEDTSLLPADFSAYLNLNLIQSYVWELKQADNPTLNFDGAVRVGPLVFEGDAQFAQRPTDTGDRYLFRRNYARLVYDQPEAYRRWYLGDLDPETRGQQSYVQMGGIGVLRQRQRFNVFRAAILQANRQLIIQRESTVRFMRNGTLYREMRLQPGRYDFSSLPLVAGSNDVQIQVTDNSGATQNLSYQQYLDPIDLDPGDYEYGAFFGPTSRSFGGAPDYRGPLAFTGFFRKAFFNHPALGVGIQASKDVQTLSGQTQFVLGNGGRLLIDAAGSHAKAAGGGWAGGLSYEHYFDRGVASDYLSFRADYQSPHFATLGNPTAVNTNAFTLTGQYTRQFDLRLIGTASASYTKSRGGLRDSYRIGANIQYRFDRQWSVRSGVDYTKYPSNLGRSAGVSFNVSLVFQPDFRRRAEARYETRDNTAELSYNQSGLNQLDSVGFGGVITRQDGNARLLGYGSYSGNRFDAAISHASFGPSLSDITALNVTTARIGTTLAYADGMFGVGRRINDSFMLLEPHKNLGKRRVVVGQSLSKNDYIGRSGPLGAAMNNFLGSYSVQSVQYDVEDPPAGYDTGPGVVRVKPPYKSGYALRVGTDAFVSVMGTLVAAPDKPVSLIGGRVTLLDAQEGENPKPVPFFTNSVGRFAISNMLPGRRYLVETYGANKTIDRAFEFTVPADTDGLVNLGTVRSGSN